MTRLGARTAEASLFESGSLLEHTIKPKTAGWCSGTKAIGSSYPTRGWRCAWGSPTIDEPRLLHPHNFGSTPLGEEDSG